MKDKSRMTKAEKINAATEYYKSLGMDKDKARAYARSSVAIEKWTKDDGERINKEIEKLLS